MLPLIELAATRPRASVTQFELACSESETTIAVRRALHVGGFHPALAHEAVRWARAQAPEEDEADVHTCESEESLPAVVPRR